MSENLQYFSRNNTPLLVYNVDAGGDHPIHGAYYMGDAWLPVTWSREGRVFEDTEHNLDIDFDRTIIE